MTIPSSLEPGRVVAGRYRVERKIGDGGMGAVYEVRHVRTDERLAMKVLHAHVLKDQTAVERFRREARAPAQIGSEHVAHVTDADTAPDLDDAPFFVMELLRGRDLESILTEEGPIPPPLLDQSEHDCLRKQEASRVSSRERLELLDQSEYDCLRKAYLDRL